MVAPVGDPEWERLRGDMALRLDGTRAALPLDAFFALNPAMPNLHRLYQAGHAAILHAVATPYRERSHFDGQDVLESGFDKPGHAESGWLNRALGVLEPAGRVSPHSRQAFAVGPLTPLVVRGPAPVLAWTPARLPSAGADTIARLHELYRHVDPRLAQALEESRGLSAMIDAMPGERIGARTRSFFTESAGAAARFLARADGPRIGALAFDGWDTHAKQGPIEGRLARLLAALDGAIEAMHREMEPVWRDTAIAIVTEFGRTARFNGTEGTDHGTATVALLLGGAIKGGRVIADWPGLRIADLHEGRDLKPTADLRAALKGLLADHLRIGEKALSTMVFPGSQAVRLLSGLVG
jgi:uncharacterized protein (DUF1501 family)